MLEVKTAAPRPVSELAVPVPAKVQKESIQERLTREKAAASAAAGQVESHSFLLLCSYESRVRRFPAHGVVKFLC